MGARCDKRASDRYIYSRMQALGAQTRAERCERTDKRHSLGGVGAAHAPTRFFMHKKVWARSNDVEDDLTISLL